MEKLPDLKGISPEEKDRLILALWVEVRELRERVAKLEAQLAQNSRNSSKPPSSDGVKKPKPKSRRGRSGRKVGGQKGHPGYRLEPVAEPEHIERYGVSQCEHCGCGLADIAAQAVERRQVFELPALKVEVTEHQAEIKCCPECGQSTEGQFPAGVEQAVQYGPQLKSTAVYFSHYQLLPFHRLGEVFEDVFCHKLSAGTLVNTNEACYEQLEGAQEQIKEQIVASAVAHFDETGVRVEGKGHWLHVASTPGLTYYAVDEKRGSKAMERMGILPRFQGTAIHDHWKPYFTYPCHHGLCNAHHLRELTFVHEHYGQAWAKDMLDCLLDIKKAVDESKTQCLEPESEQRRAFAVRYDEIIEEGLRVNPLPEPPAEGAAKKRGRKKQSKPKNLLDRLKGFKKEVLAFMDDSQIPFDNNQGERDVRMMKVQQKISGTFRSQHGAGVFARIRGYISTARKNGVNVMEALLGAFQGNPFSPALPGP